jgi:Arc/MetJ family transcription regulator
MAATLTSIRLDKKLADEVKRALGVKTRTEAVHVALREIAGNRRFKAVVKKYEGKLKFADSDE